MNKSFVANSIKDRVKVPELVRYYGFVTSKRNRIPCHIHGGKNDNLGIKQEYCHCFKCGYNADVIKFVQDYFSLSFDDAVAKINTDFSLGLPISERIDKRRQTDIARQSFLRKQEHKKKEEEHERYLTAWLEAHGELIRLERQKIDYRPKSACEELHPKYIEAIKEIEYAKHRLGCAEEDLYNYEQTSC